MSRSEHVCALLVAVVVLAQSVVGCTTVRSAESSSASQQVASATGRLEQTDRTGRRRYGTAFLVDVNPSRRVLITCAHVIDAFPNDVASLVSHNPRTNQRLTLAITIRTNGRPLFVVSRRADVAALRVERRVTSAMGAIPFDGLVRDRRAVVSLGHSVYAIGYPRGAEGIAPGAPILRNAIVASLDHRALSFLLDMPVMPGNSGSPVYSVDARQHLRIVGMVFSRRTWSGASLTSNGAVTTEPLDIAEAVHASEIVTLIDQLMAPTPTDHD